MAIIMKMRLEKLTKGRVRATIKRNEKRAGAASTATTATTATATTATSAATTRTRAKGMTLYIAKLQGKQRAANGALWKEGKRAGGREESELALMLLTQRDQRCPKPVDCATSLNAWATAGQAIGPKAVKISQESPSRRGQHCEH